jgi:hypothetical protein
MAKWFGVIGVWIFAHSAVGGEPGLDLGEAMVEFARSRLGERVGSGECAALVFEAFRAVGAEEPMRRGESEEWEWGRPVQALGDVRAGDVVEFHQVTFSGRRRLQKSGRPRIEVWRRTYPDHLAIVGEVRDGGRTWVLLHQNVGPTNAPEGERKRVQETVLELGARRAGGTIRVYRPRSAGSGEKAGVR